MTSRELAVAGWAAAALSWSGMCPCVWPSLVLPFQLATGCQFCSNLLALVASKSEFREQRLMSWANVDLKPVLL